MTIRKSHAEKVREWKLKNGDPIKIGENGQDPALGLAEVMAGGKLEPTQVDFFSDNSRYKGYKGPAGCGKSVIGCISGLSRALWQPGSVGVIAQHDYNHLLASTYQTFDKLLRRLPLGIVVERDKSPPMKLTINPINGGLPSTIIFMGLKENLGGYEFNWAFLDEADKIDERAVRLIDGRLRYEGGGYSLMMAFNPPDKHHWLYTACTGRDYQEKPIQAPWLKLFEPRKNENSRNLPAGYYDNLRKSYTEDMVQRLVDGEWGSTFEGQPVFREFKQSVHVRDELKKYFDPYKPLLRFWDFGYNHPYCCWAQVDWEGRLRVFKEHMGSMVEATTFARTCKAITTQAFPQAQEILDYGDPAVSQKKDTGQTLAQFIKEGIIIRYRRSQIEEGLRVIRQRLNLLIGGEPALQFDRLGCPILIGTMRGGYALDSKGEKPVKDGHYDHPADAFRYGCINVLGGAMGVEGYKLQGKYGYNASGMPESIEYRPEMDLEVSHE